MLARTAAGLAALHRSEAWHGELLTFEADDVVQRIEKLGDLFKPILKLRQKLPHL